MLDLVHCFQLLQESGAGCLVGVVDEGDVSIAGALQLRKVCNFVVVLAVQLGDVGEDLRRSVGINVAHEIVHVGF